MFFLEVIGYQSYLAFLSNKVLSFSFIKIGLIYNRNRYDFI